MVCECQKKVKILNLTCNMMLMFVILSQLHIANAIVEDPCSCCHCSLLHWSWWQELIASPSLAAVVVVVVDIALLTTTSLTQHLDIPLDNMYTMVSYLYPLVERRVQRAIRSFVQASKSRGKGLQVSVKHQLFPQLQMNHVRMVVRLLPWQQFERKWNACPW